MSGSFSRIIHRTLNWQHRGDKPLGIGHVFKYPYHWYDLLRRVKDPALKPEWDAKAYRVF